MYTASLMLQSARSSFRPWARKACSAWLRSPKSRTAGFPMAELSRHAAPSARSKIPLRIDRFPSHDMRSSTFREMEPVCKDAPKRGSFGEIIEKTHFAHPPSGGRCAMFMELDARCKLKVLMVDDSLAIQQSFG